MAATDVRQLKRRLAERTGLDLGLLDRPALSGFVQRRCRELGLPDEAAYHALVMRDSDEMERLVQEVSVAETWLFRYPASFQLLVDHAAGLLRRKRNEIRMLSIACATGEEPYGMAMAAAEAGWPLDRVAVDAVDRHEASLAIAREACYRGNSFRETMPDWAQKWFCCAEDGAQVDARIVAAVNFSHHDILTASLPAGRAPYDVVFCRNLFIYLGDAARTKLADLLASVISPDGILFVGHAECAILPDESFESAGVKHAFALRPKRSEPAPAKTPVVIRKAISQPAAPRKRANETAPPSKPVLPPRTAAETREVPTRGDVTLEHARALADAGQLEAAIAAIEAIQWPRPACPETFDLLGSIQLNLGRLEQARDAFHKALYLEPNHETALLQMAIVCDRLGNTDQAARYRRRAARAHDEASKPPS
jgi:chemotaxis protein methyltransferase WspC